MVLLSYRTLRKPRCTAKVSVRNGTKHYLNLQFAVLDHIEFDMILGRNYRQMFGYRLTGVPTKLPGPALFEPDNLIPPATLDDIIPEPVTYQPLIEALRLNTTVTYAAT
jgi:hypothetical protein